MNTTAADYMRWLERPELSDTTAGQLRRLLRVMSTGEGIHVIRESGDILWAGPILEPPTAARRRIFEENARANGYRYPPADWFGQRISRISQLWAGPILEPPTAARQGR